MHSVRLIASRGEYEACVDLQEEVWGEGYRELVPAALLKVANRLGGIVAGVFRDDGTLDGFVFGITGVVDGAPVHWSDTLAVRAALRDQGLGARLKRFQRDLLLTRGVTRMHWTFDPLQGRNAHVNFVKLGIVCREYVRDMYGDSDSPLHRGISTDRLVATWEMDSERVVGRLAGEQWSLRATEMEPLPGILAPGVRGPFPEPGRPRLGLEGKALLLAIPAEMEPLMERDLPLAVRWREATRAAFLHYLSRGYELREFFRGAVVSHYMLALVDS